MHFPHTVGGIVSDLSMESMSYSPPHVLCWPIFADTSTGVVCLPISLKPSVQVSFHLGSCPDTNSWIHHWLLWYSAHGTGP